MNREYIYIEPSILAYKINIKPEMIDYSDRDDIIEYISELAILLDVWEKYKIVLLMIDKIYMSILNHSPFLPFNTDIIDDYKLKSTISLLYRRFKNFISSSIRIPLQNQCGLSEKCYDEISMINDFYLDFYELLLSGCINNKNDNPSSDYILKSSHSSNFEGNELIVDCDNDCSSSFSRRHRIIDSKEYESILAAKSLRDKFFKSQYEYIAESDIATQDDQHRGAFPKRIRKFSDIPMPERELFILLNRIVGVRKIFFRQYGNGMKHPAVTFSDWEILQCDDAELLRLCGNLYLKQRAGRPNECTVEIYVLKDRFLDLQNCILNNINVITVPILSDTLEKMSVICQC